MPNFAASAIWAARFGLLLALFTYISGDKRGRNDNPFAKYLVLAVLAATFVPTRSWNTIKLHAITILRNTAFALILVFIAFTAAVLAVAINDKILPELGRLLRKSELSAAWPVGLTLVVIFANIPWKALFQKLGIMLGFQDAHLGSQRKEAHMAQHN